MLDPPQREDQYPYRSYLTPEAQLNARNRHHVEADRGLPEEEVRRRALDTHSRLRDALSKVRDETLSTRYSPTEVAFEPNPGGRSLACLIAIETHWHYDDHADELERRNQETPAGR